MSKDRLQLKFNRAYRYFEVLFDGQNPYVDAIKNNLTHLVKVLKTGQWQLLRRDPPYFLGVSGAVENVDYMVQKLLAGVPQQQATPADVRTA